jgi:cytochrome c
MVAFAEGDKVWSEELMREYFIAPRAVVKGTKMAFAGLKKPEDLDNLMAYFRSLSVEN